MDPMGKKEGTQTRSDVDARSQEHDEGTRIGRGNLGGEGDNYEVKENL